jgi:hypothetical protein
MKQAGANRSYSCRCRVQFCYLCVKKWKTCKCPVWDERNIINVVQPAPGQVAPAPAPASAPFGNAAPGAFGNPAPALMVPVAPAVAAFAAQAQTNIAPRVFGIPFPVQALTQAQTQQLRHGQGPSARTKRRRDQRDRHRQPAHEHDFERYYHSNGWDTTCHLCGHADRWVNCCSDCDLKVCWYCTKHRA